MCVFFWFNKTVHVSIRATINITFNSMTGLWFHFAVALASIQSSGRFESIGLIVVTAYGFFSTFKIENYALLDYVSKGRFCGGDGVGRPYRTKGHTHTHKSIHFLCD